MSSRERVVIVGAGGRDFHVFNTLFRDDPAVEVVAFTAAQIPNIADRSYPPALAGPAYPGGIPIVPEADLERLVGEHAVSRVVFAYSDVTLTYVDGLARRVAAAGATLVPFDTEACLLRSRRPTVAVCAVRTGCGKSPVSRVVADELRRCELRAGVIRHPMPYGNLRAQAVQRFATLADLERNECTIEEMEEYEPHVSAGNVVFAGVDYAKILAAAEDECDVILWDGGNNDTPFVRPDLLFTLLDALRPGDELTYFPGRWNLEHADVLLLSKSDRATPDGLATLRSSAQRHNPRAALVEGRLAVHAADTGAIAGRRALVVEDGPTLTHGGMGYGAGLVAARRAGAAEIVDPRPYAVGQIATAFETYPHLESVLPALGYGADGIADLEASIAATPCDVVIVATPVDLRRIIRIAAPTVRVTYEYEDASSPGVRAHVRTWAVSTGRQPSRAG